MEHSRQPNKAGVKVSGKINNNESFSSSSKTIYDDVYGGPPKFGVSTLSPRFEDYSEIFCSFHTARASSIPVLDLPAVCDAEAFFDPRAHSFNYAEVFGAFDFAVPYLNLCASSDEAWFPAETDSFSGESEGSANNQSMSNGDIFHSLDGNTGFKVLYQNKVHSTSNGHKSKGKTHMTQLHAVPGFSGVYDETTQIHCIDPSFQVADDIDLDIELCAKKVKGNHPRKTIAHLPNFTSGEQTFDGDLNLQNGGSRKVSHSSEMFVTVSDISLRSMPTQVPPPSRPPPGLDAKKGDVCEFHSNSRLVDSEETPGAGSPPFLDVEDHMNSSAIASADAMKEAMLRAEAKFRSAKELKGRKKGGCESHLKSSYDVQINEAKMCKDITGFSSLNDETYQGSYDKRHSKTKFSVTDDRQSLEGKRIVNIFDKNNKMESRLSQESDRSTGVEIWKDESEFFELVGKEDSVTQPTTQSKNFVQGTGSEKNGQKEREASNLQEKNKQIKATEENYQGEEYNKKYKAAEEASEHDENIVKSEASNKKWSKRDSVKKEKVMKVFEVEDNEKSIKIAHLVHGKTEKKVEEADQSRIMEDVSEMGHGEHKQVEIQKPKEVDRQIPNKVQLVMGLRENEKKLKEVEKQQHSVKRHKQSENIEENRKTQREASSLGQTEHEEKLKGYVELEDVDERSNVAFDLDYTEEKEVCKSEIEMKPKLGNQIQINKGLREASERVEIDKSLKSSENEESDGGLMPAFRWDENEKQLKEDFQLEGNDIRLKAASEQREIEAYERDVCDGHGEGNRIKEASANRGSQKVMPLQEHINGMLNDAQRKKVTKSISSQTFAMEGRVAVSNGDSHLEQSENMEKDVDGTEKDKGLNALDDMERKEDRGNMKNAKATDETLEVESDEDLATLSASIHEEVIGKLKISKESVSDQDIGKMRTECEVEEKKLKQIELENQLTDEKMRAPEMVVGDAGHSEKEGDIVTKADYRRSTEAAEPATVQETVDVQEIAQWFHDGQSAKSKAKSINETSATVKDAERTRRERDPEKDHLRKTEDKGDREREQEKNVEKSMLEAEREREREREREKDRMAIDRENFEVHDKAYAEACERAAFERATVEARYKALVEARERLEKACAEARDKSYIDKETTEARLKAERAAVERATAEAQARAMEKLKNEHTAFESRERLERSVSDNFCGRQDSSSSDMLDPQLQNFRGSTGSRHPYSLYGAASFSERSEREGESAQRCRSRLERHRRTSERVAKALAEKNMRDLLAQKEQAERNRLSETLDAEVRRWSGGKEGNLRALLSTLQYILGPDSGWQSIPLTEVITSAAVKKAYRKATLCVHPDKLQQRGASIQHKYICEKVFDLLKDAWNKFNSEER